MGTVIAVCTSPAKGTQKTDVKEAVFIEDFGIEGDAHAGKWHLRGSISAHFRWERDWTAVMWYWRSPRSERSAITDAGYFRRWGIASCPGKASSRKWSGAV